MVYQLDVTPSEATFLLVTETTTLLGMYSAQRFCVRRHLNSKNGVWRVLFLRMDIIFVSLTIFTYLVRAAS